MEKCKSGFILKSWKSGKIGSKFLGKTAKTRWISLEKRQKCITFGMDEAMNCLSFRYLEQNEELMLKGRLMVVYIIVK